MKLGFEDYMKQHGQALQRYKKLVNKSVGGEKLEQYTHAILTMTDMTISKTTPRIDMGFGADFLISYVEDNTNHSVYVDITTYTKGADTKYLKLDGSMVDTYEDGFIAEFGFGKVAFGLKFKHANRFEYEKPVIVLVFQNVDLRGKGIDVSDTEVRMIESFIKSLNNMLITQYKCNKRASKVIHI